MKLEKDTIYTMPNGDHILVTELPPVTDSTPEDAKERSAPEDARFVGTYVDNRGWNWYREDGQICGGHPDHHLNLVAKAKAAESDTEE